jgi:hypothetical protein
VALKAYSDATQAMIVVEGEDWRLACESATSAEAICRDCREALLAHERSHKCTP